MKALVFTHYKRTPSVEIVPDPTPPEDGIVLKVEASGICRSDWHGWMGHDPDIKLPHVPGHEMAGTIAELGSNLDAWKVGDRVTLPFVCACGICEQCHAGQHQVCDDQFQPGFTHWGSFAEYVAIHRAAVNLVALPQSIDFASAASLGCRFATSFRAIVHQAQVKTKEWVAVHGCGGVGLSAIMIAKAMGAKVIAVDISKKSLEQASRLGADHGIISSDRNEILEAIRDISDGGVHVSLDALGDPKTYYNSVASLRKRGRHIQVGLMVGDHRNAPMPIDEVIAKELEIYGSHGMAAHSYQEMLSWIENGRLQPKKLIAATISLEEASTVLSSMDKPKESGIHVITKF